MWKSLFWNISRSTAFFVFMFRCSISPFAVSRTWSQK
jgi:hypothetical protein